MKPKIQLNLLPKKTPQQSALDKMKSQPKLQINLKKPVQNQPPTTGIYV